VEHGLRSFLAHERRERRPVPDVDAGEAHLPGRHAFERLDGAAVAAFERIDGDDARGSPAEQLAHGVRPDVSGRAGDEAVHGVIGRLSGGGSPPGRV